MSDPLMDRLAALPMVEPDARRAAATAAQCRARLAARAPSALTVEARVRDRLWRSAAAALGLAYLIQALGLALRVYGAK